MSRCLPVSPSHFGGISLFLKRWNFVPLAHRYVFWRAHSYFSYISRFGSSAMPIFTSPMVVQFASDTTVTATPMQDPTPAGPANTPPTSSASVLAQLNGLERRARTQLGSSSVSASPSSSASPAPNSSTSSSSLNKAAVIGVFIAVGLVMAILLASGITCLVRRRRQRQRQRDKEMDVSFRETMDRAADGWRQMPSLDRSALWQKTPSVSSTASHGTCVQAIAVPPPQYDSGFAPRRDDAPGQHWDAGLARIGAASRIEAAKITQPQRAASVYPTHTSGDSASIRALARRPSHSAVVHHPEAHLPANALPSIYTSSPPPMESVSPVLTTVSPVSPTALPNPYDGGDLEKRVRSTHLLSPNPMPRPNSLSTSPTTPISPTPLPNPYDAQEGEKRLTTNMPLSPMPLSPTPLPNPYG